MIEFELSTQDQKILDEIRSQALVARQYARHYDENEHEFPPDQLEEAKDHPTLTALLRGRSGEDTGMATLGMLAAAGQT